LVLKLLLESQFIVIKDYISLPSKWVLLIAN